MLYVALTHSAFVITLLPNSLFANDFSMCVRFVLDVKMYILPSHGRRYFIYHVVCLSLIAKKGASRTIKFQSEKKIGSSIRWTLSLCRFLCSRTHSIKLQQSDNGMLFFLCFVN